MEKKGQVTIFILIALLLVSAVIVYFIWVSPTSSVGRTERPGFEGCVADALGQEIQELGKKGGYVTPGFSYMYRGEKIPYLCFTNEYYRTCVVQEPFLKQRFEKSLQETIKPSLDTCYQNSLNELSGQGYDVKAGALNYSVVLDLGKARVDIAAPTSVGTRKLSRFKAELDSPMYEMVMIATSIIQSEAKYGDASTDPYRLLYPDYIVDKLKQGEGTTLYVIESKIYGDTLQFASKSLPWPAGFDR